MSGLVTETRQKGRGSGLSQGFTFHRFTSTYSNWPKPYGCTMIIIECIGGGGSGGSGEGRAAGNNRNAGGGGDNQEEQEKQTQVGGVVEGR